MAFEYTSPSAAPGGARRGAERTSAGGGRRGVGPNNHFGRPRTLHVGSGASAVTIDRERGISGRRRAQCRARERCGTNSQRRAARDRRPETSSQRQEARNEEGHRGGAPRWPTRCSDRVIDLGGRDLRIEAVLRESDEGAHRGGLAGAGQLELDRGRRATRPARATPSRAIPAPAAPALAFTRAARFAPWPTHDRRPLASVSRDHDASHEQARWQTVMEVDAHRKASLGEWSGGATERAPAHDLLHGSTYVA